MKWLWALIILGLVLVFVFKKDLNNFNNMDDNKNNISSVSEYKTFECEGFDFAFQFPDFKGWELKNIEKVNENRCYLYFNWPDDVLYEIPPRINVEKIASGDKSQKAKQNPQSVYYEYITDPSLYVNGHKFEEGDWDSLVFYGGGFNVRIGRNMFGKSPFDADLFYNKIIETFDFK